MPRSEIQLGDDDRVNLENLMEILRSATPGQRISSELENIVDWIQKQSDVFHNLSKGINDEKSFPKMKVKIKHTFKMDRVNCVNYFFF